MRGEGADDCQQVLEGTTTARCRGLKGQRALLIDGLSPLTLQTSAPAPLTYRVEKGT